MSLNINALETCTDLTKFIMVEERRYVTIKDDCIHVLSTYMMHGWPSARAVVIKETQLY